MKCCICNSNFKILTYLLHGECKKEDRKIKYELYREGDIDKVTKLAPLLLHCGHAICVNCFKSGGKSVNCSLCSMDTVISEDLSQHHYIFGYLLSKAEKKLYSNTLQDVKSTSIVDMSKNEDLCQECSSADMEYHCQICSTDLCSFCFQKIHTPKTMKHHKAEKLIGKFSLGRIDCEIHDKECDFICNTCSDIHGSTKVICSVCHFAGDHTLHSYTRLEDWNRDHFDEFTSLRRMLKTKIDQLLKNKQVFIDNIQKLQKFTEETELFLSDVFLKAHGQLQMNYQTILAQLRDLTTKNVDAFQDLVSDMEKKIVTANKYFNSANSVQEKNILSVNISLLMGNMLNFVDQTLSSFEIPSELLKQETNKPENCIRFNFNLEENPLSKFVYFDSQNFENHFKLQSKNKVPSNELKTNPSCSSSSDLSNVTEIETEKVKIKQKVGVERNIADYVELEEFSQESETNSNISNDLEQELLETNMIPSVANKNYEESINETKSIFGFPEQIKPTKTESFKIASDYQESFLYNLKNEHDNSGNMKGRSINAIHMEEGVLVSHIDEKLKNFYIQRVSDKNKIEELSKNIRCFIPNGKMFKENPSPGTLCLGQYDRDDCWYRALILHMKNKKFLVKFIDYGNIEHISLKKLRECPEDLQLEAIPSFAYPCSLWGITPVESKCFSCEAVALFHHLVTFQKRMDLLVYSSQQVLNFKEQRPLIYVDICCISDIDSVSDDLSLSIRECFLFLEFGRSTLSEEENFSVKKIENNFFERSYHKPHILLNAAPIQVKITRLDSPSSFYVQCCSSKASLKITLGEMKQHYTSENVSNISWKILAPKIGMLCAVKCTSDNLWFRARINDLRSGSNVLVTNVDTGEQEEVYYERLRKIPDKFLQVSAQGIHCKLANIVPVNDDVWEPLAVEKFRDIIVENDSIMATFHKRSEDIYEANLLIYHIDRQTNIACELLDSDLALPSQDLQSEYFNENHMENSCHKDEFDTFSRRSIKKVNPLKKSSQIIVDSDKAIRPTANQIENSSSKSLFHALDIIDIISPSLIFARFSEDQKLYEEYQDSLYNKMISMSRKKKVVTEFRPQISKYCVAKFNQSPFFARVFLLEKCELFYKAFLVDFGGVKNIPEKELLPLPKGMKKKIPKLCQALSMAGICPPCGSKVWPTSTVDFLKSVLNSNGQIYMLKRGCCYRDVNSWNLKVIPVDLGLFEEKPSGPFTSSTSVFRNIKTDILEKGLALPNSEKLHNMSIASSMDTLAAVGDDESNSSTTASSKLNEDNKNLNSEICDSVSEIEIDMNTELEMSSQNSSSSFSGIPSEVGIFDNTCLPAQPPLEMKFLAVVTFVESDGIVCLHPLESNERLSMMKKAHNLKFNDSQLTDKDLSWDIGYYVVAKYYLDKSWYRAKILNSKNDNGEVKVEFIDYGNVEYVNVEEIRIDFPFMNIPIQCYKCTLGLAPLEGVWTERLIQFFHEVVVMKNHQVTILEENEDSLPLVELIQEGNEISNVGDFFVNSLRVCVYKNSSVKYNDQESESSCDIIIESDEVFTVKELSYPTDPSELVVVKVVSVVDPSLCYISPQKDVINPTCVGNFWKQAVKAIKAMEELQGFLRVNYSEYKLNETPLVGGIYLSRFAKEGNSFLRVKVFNVGNDEVLVKFVDFGNERKISTKSLYLIPKKYRKVPALAIEVRLSEIYDQILEDKLEILNIQDVEDCLMHTDKKIFTSFRDTGDPPAVSLFYKDENGEKVLCYDHLLQKSKL